MPGKYLVHDEHEPDAALLDVVRRDLALELRRLAVQQLRERRMVLRDVVAGDEPLVVDEHGRLVRRAVRLVLVDGPRRQLRRFRRLVGHRLALVDELDLQVHRRAPHHVGAALSRRRFGDEAVVHLGRVHVVVFDLDVGIERVEILDQRLRGLRVERAVDDDLAFLLRGGDRLGVIGRVAGGYRLREDRRDDRREDKQGKTWRHAILQEMG
jgi:hypothetical protein